MKYMIDINTSLFILKNKPLTIKRKLEKIKLSELFISTIVVSELIYKVYLTNEKKNLEILNSFLFGFEIADYDFLAAIEFGKIKSLLKNKEQVMDNIDIQIGAHAKSFKAQLITEKVEYFKKIKNLEITNWL